jgi:hypothetical protein
MADIHQVLHPTTRQYTLFSAAWNFLQNRAYFWKQGKSQQIQENQSNLLHHIRSQQNKTKTQQ